MDKNKPKIQHIVPQCIIKQWKIESTDKNKPSMLKILDKEEIKIIKFRDNKKYFAEDYKFETDINSPNGRIEKKLSRVEQNYAQYAKRLIDSEKTIKENKKFSMSIKEKATVLTFMWTQKHRANLSTTVYKNNLIREKELIEIEKILDEYFHFQKMSEEKIENEYYTIDAQLKKNQEKYQHNSKKRIADFWRILSEPLKKIIFYTINPYYSFALRYFEQPIWPLPIQGNFIWDFSDEEIESRMHFLPITPRIVLFHTWTVVKTIEQKEKLKKRTFDAFCDEHLQDTIFWILLHYSFNSKMPVILSNQWKINDAKLQKEYRFIEKVQKEMKKLNQKNKHKRKKWY